MLLQIIRIRRHEVGLLFRDREFRGLLEPGRHWFVDPLNKIQVEIVSERKPWLAHEQLDVIAKSGVLEGRAKVVDLKDHERGLVWVDGRFSQVLTPGLYAYWTTVRDVRVEVIDARDVRFVHPELPAILKLQVSPVLDVHTVPAGQVGAWYRDGVLVDLLPPGRHAFWKQLADVRVVPIETREVLVDLGGQEIMTADKVTLRLNAMIGYRVADVRLALSAVEDVRQALYREAQLALRAAVGARELDAFLADKDSLARELEETVRKRAVSFGLEIASVGIRDVILPGEMKDLFNKVTEAKKAAEANAIARREETAAMRSQANTAKLLQDNPTLMRLRELEVLEKVAGQAKLNVVLGDKGLTERVVNLL